MEAGEEQHGLRGAELVHGSLVAAGRAALLPLATAAPDCRHAATAAVLHLPWLGGGGGGGSSPLCSYPLLCLAAGCWPALG